MRGEYYDSFIYSTSSWSELVEADFVFHFESCCVLELISSIQKGISESNRFEKKEKAMMGGAGPGPVYQQPPKGVPNTSHIFGSGTGGMSK